MANFGGYGTYWSGTTSSGTSSSGGWGTRSYRYTQDYIDDTRIKPRSDAQQLNEGWDADENPS